MRLATIGFVLLLCSQPEAPRQEPGATNVPVKPGDETGFDSSAPEPSAPTSSDTPWTDGGAVRRSLERAARLLATEDMAWSLPVTPRAPAPAQDGSIDSVLTGMAQATDSSQRIRAIEGWTMYSGPPPLAQLAEYLDDPDEEVRAAAARALAQITPDVLAEYVLSVLTGTDARAAAALVAALPELNAALAAPMLRTFQSAGETSLRRQAAAFCLGQMRCRDAAVLLAEGIWAADPDMANTCANALYALRAPESVPVWLRLTRHSARAIQELAIHALGAVGGPEAYQALRLVASGEAGLDVELQCQAAAGLAGWPKREAIPVLIDILAANMQVRRCAAELLRRLTGVSLGEQPEAWRQWYNRPPTPMMPGEVESVPP